MEVRAKYDSFGKHYLRILRIGFDAEPIKVASESVTCYRGHLQEILRDIVSWWAKEETGAADIWYVRLPEVLEAKAALKEDAARLGMSLADQFKIPELNPDVIAMMTGEVPGVGRANYNYTTVQRWKHYCHQWH